MAPHLNIPPLLLGPKPVTNGSRLHPKIWKRPNPLESRNSFGLFLPLTVGETGIIIRPQFHAAPRLTIAH